MRRAAYLRHIQQYLPEERVYVDESRFDRRTANRTHAWSLAGTRSMKTVFFLRGMRYVDKLFTIQTCHSLVISFSILPALSLDGILHVKVVDGSFNSETFLEFIKEVVSKMNPYDPVQHNKNSVLILDNCRIHKDPAIIELVESRYVSNNI